MSLEKAKIEGVIYDVLTEQEYMQNKYMGLIGPYTAIKRGNGLVYPCRSSKDYRPGFYDLGMFYFYKDPAYEERDFYSEQNIISFATATNLREVIQTQQRLTNAERTILTTIENVFAPEISDNDTPEMVALKQAILCKHIDLDKYEARFGPNYNNDKRLLKKDSITFGKLRTICDALDIKATITFEDANPDVPNPIGRVITTELTGEQMSVEEDS